MGASLANMGGGVGAGDPLAAAAQGGKGGAALGPWGAAAGAGLGLLGGMGGKSNATTPQIQTQQTTAPDYLQPGLEDAASFFTSVFDPSFSATPRTDARMAGQPGWGPAQSPQAQPQQAQMPPQGGPMGGPQGGPMGGMPQGSPLDPRMGGGGMTTPGQMGPRFA